MPCTECNEEEIVLRLPHLNHAHHSTAQTIRCPTPESPCVTCKKVADLEKRMKRTIEKLKEMIMEHQSLKSDMNQDPGIINRTLPVEIISKIFVFAKNKDEFGTGQNIPHVVNKRSIMWMFTLGTICRFWRRIAWSTPQLWTTILMSLDRRESLVDIEELLKWIQRSGGLQVEVYVYTTDTNLEHTAGLERARKNQESRFPSCFGLLRVLGQISSRTKSLRVDIPLSFAVDMFKSSGELPVLDTLRLRLTDYDDEEGNDTPKLFKNFIPSPRHVELLNKMPPKYCNINWLNVRHVKGRELTVSQCKELFRLSSALKSFSVDSIRHFSPSLHQVSPTSSSPPLKSRITELSVYFIGDRHAFSFITFPNLRHLKVDTLGEPVNGVAALINLLNQVPGTLESADLPIADLPLASIYDIFAETSSIIHLRVRPTRYGNSKMENTATKEFLMHLAQTAATRTNGMVMHGRKNRRLILPNLKSLEYDCSWSQRFPWEVALDIFGPAPNALGFNSPNHRPLRSLKVVKSTGPYSSSIPQKYLIRLQELKRAGIDIQYQ